VKKEIKEVSQCVREVTLTVEPERALEDYKKVLRRYKNLAVVPGFRKGKAPLHMLEKLYGEVIKSEFVRQQVGVYYEEMMKDDETINPVSEAYPTDYNWEKGEDFTAIFRYEVAPELNELNYKNIEVPFKALGLEDGSVEKQITEIQEKMATIEIIPEPVNENSLVDIEIVYTDAEGNPLEEPVTREIDMQKNVFSKDFNETILGKKAGDTFEAIMLDPKEGEEEKKKNNFKVIDVKHKVLPELDDEFAKDADYDSLEDMKAKIEEELKVQNERSNNEQRRQAITMALIENNKFDVPASVVERYAKSQAEEQAKYYNTKSEELLPFFRQMGQFEVKKFYVLDFIKSAENIEATEEDINTLAEEAAANMNMSFDEYKEKFKKQMEDANFIEAVKDRKVYNLVESTATFVEPKQEEPKEESTDAETKE
jgi:trigger factor